MSEAAKEQSPEYRPDFVFGGNRKISEENWLEYEAQGARNVIESIPEEDEEALRKELEWGRRYYGAENILLGDAFDADAGRPLRLKPGIGIYVTAEGGEYNRRHFGKSTSAPTKHPPVMILPDGSSVVARPGTKVKVQHKP